MLKIKWIIPILGCFLAISFGFSNCAENSDFSGADVSASSLAAENLLSLLDDAKETEAMLNEQGSPSAVAQANEIRTYIDIIEDMISLEGQGLAISAPQVLDARDYLLNAHLMGRDMLIRFDLDQAIADLQAEDARLNQMILDLEAAMNDSLTALEDRLRNEIKASEATIQAQVDSLRQNFQSFQSQVTNKFIEVDGQLVNVQNVTDILSQRIDQVNNNITIIENNITNIENSSGSAMQALREALDNLEVELKQQIVEVQEQQNQLKEELTEHQQALNAFISDQTQLAEIQGQMCQLGAAGDILPGQNVCSGASSEDDVLDGQCCMTAENLDCDMMFPGESDSATLANQQCQSFVVTLRNRNDQMKELAENDAQQKADIEQLFASLDDLEAVVAGLSDEVKTMSEEVDSLKGQLTDMDDRLLLVEFKASRAEAGAALGEMSDLLMAWITRRKADVRRAFCSRNAHQAYQRSDYESAKQNWAYCVQRLNWLNQAQELTNLAKAYTQAVLATNVDQNCSAVVKGKNVETLTMDELDVYSTADSVINKCQSGGALVKAYLISIIKLHKKIAPDFRTAEYMAKKAKIAQLLYFGREVHQASSEAIRAFENVDPTSSALQGTPYGKIERVFKRRYVETRLRLSDNSYPENPSQFKADIAGFDQVYSHEEINSASNDYLARVKALEIQGSCSNRCGFKVVARNQVQSIGERFSFPKDSKTQCPIHDDAVMVPSKDGKHYAYRVSYSRYRGAWENLKPYWTWNSNHYPVAESDEDVESGQFRRCGYRVRHSVHRFGIPDTKLRGRLVLGYGRPYAKSHGLPQCMRFRFSCRLWDGPDGQGEWVASNPNANITHYLSGFSEERVTNLCKESGAAYVHNKRDMLDDEKANVYYYKGRQDADSLIMTSRITASTTQLTDEYWMTKDESIDYGVGNEGTSRTYPFYGKASSHGQPFFRKLKKLEDFGNIEVQQCYDPVTQ